MKLPKSIRHKKFFKKKIFAIVFFWHLLRIKALVRISLAYSFIHCSQVIFYYYLVGSMLRIPLYYLRINEKLFIYQIEVRDSLKLKQAYSNKLASFTLFSDLFGLDQTGFKNRSSLVLWKLDLDSGALWSFSIHTKPNIISLGNIIVLRIKSRGSKPY